MTVKKISDNFFLKIFFSNCLGFANLDQIDEKVEDFGGYGKVLQSVIKLLISWGIPPLGSWNGLELVDDR